MNYPAATVRDLTVQEIQLELIRRTRFNAMDGERVYASLLAHRHLWVAALLDRPGFANYEEPGDLLGMGLIRLRDLPANIWNADTLYLLTKSRDQAIELARLIEAQDWAGEVQVHEDEQELSRALGSSCKDRGLVSVWWD